MTAIKELDIAGCKRHRLQQLLRGYIDLRRSGTDLSYDRAIQEIKAQLKKKHHSK